MEGNHHQVSYFARSNHRDSSRRIGIKQDDRLSHLYVIGKTGVGKTTLLETLIAQDIDAGRGCALVDPHGDFVERVSSASRKNGSDSASLPCACNRAPTLLI